MRKSLSSPRRRGAAAVELGFVAPLFFILLVGIWEVGRLVHVQQIVMNAAREGARQAATAKYTKAEVEEAVLDYLANANLPTAGVEVTVLNEDAPTEEIFSAAQKTHVSVKVRYPFENVRWFGTGGFDNNAARDVQSGGFKRSDTGTDYGTYGPKKHVQEGAMIESKADWLIMKDIPIEVDTAIPSTPLS